MDEEKLKVTNDFLARHGSSAEVITKARMEQLSKIYDASVARQTACFQAKESLKSNGITVVAIAEDTGISRKTFYNNPLLKDFVQEFATSTTDFTEVKEKELERLKEQNGIISEQIRQMFLRDSESEDFKHEIAVLRRDIKQKDNRIQNLEKQLEKALNELEGEKKKTPFTPNIIKIIN